MTYTVLPGLVPFGVVFDEVSRARSYAGPQMPNLGSPQGEVRRTVMGVQMSNGEFLVDHESPLAVYAVMHQRWEREVRQFILDVMSREEEYATLVMDDPAVPAKAIAASALRHVDTARLRYSIFDVLDHHLQALRTYDGAKILVSKLLAETVRKALTARPTTGGRPNLSAKQWYFERGCDRGRLSMKELQAQMPRDPKGNPPGASTIRGWEKEYSRQKPPTGTS